MEHIVVYRDSFQGVEMIKTIIHEKVLRQMHLVKKHDKDFIVPEIVITGIGVREILLCEARYAKLYWKHFGKLLPNWCKWKTRNPYSSDTINKLLDIGYHTLVTIIQKKCDTLDIPTEIGLFHRAQSKHAHPLIYDIMEVFRVILVDEILLKFIHMKKEPISKIDSQDIQYFLHDVYEKLNYEYYHNNRKSCITLSYWIDLILLELRGSISEKRLFKPKFVPLRHENRCNKKPQKLE